jgi:hypothetical protein
MGRQLSRLEEDCERADMVRKALHNQVVELKGACLVYIEIYMCVYIMLTLTPHIPTHKPQPIHK